MKDKQTITELMYQVITGPNEMTESGEGFSIFGRTKELRLCDRLESKILNKTK